MVSTHPSIGALVVNIILVLPSPYHTKRGGEEGRKCREEVDMKGLQLQGEFIPTSVHARSSLT